jgi:hypothetical protein
MLQAYCTYCIAKSLYFRVYVRYLGIGMLAPGSDRMLVSSKSIASVCYSWQILYVRDLRFQYAVVR